MEDKVIDFNGILNQCGIGVEPAAQVIKNLSALEEFYGSKELIKIYNYCLLNVKDADILLHVIKLADFYKNELTLNIIVNMLKQRPNEDNEQLINLRSMCAKAIANYKDTSTVVVLLDCLNNKKENYKVRLSCADALGRIGDKYAVKPLLEVVEDEEERSVYLKESAAFALGLLGDTSAIDPLVAILESKQGLLDRFSFLKEKIVEALGKLNINNKKVMRALKSSLMDSSPIVRINAIEAIMNSEDEEAPSLIRPSLQDEDDEVKRNALIALYNLQGRSALDEVIELPIYSQFLKDEARELIEEYETDEEQ